jgi:hypothetical protein
MTGSAIHHPDAMLGPWCPAFKHFNMPIIGQQEPMETYERSMNEIAGKDPNCFQIGPKGMHGVDAVCKFDRIRRKGNVYTVDATCVYEPMKPEVAFTMDGDKLIMKWSAFSE